MASFVKPLQTITQAKKSGACLVRRSAITGLAFIALFNMGSVHAAEQRPGWMMLRPGVAALVEVAPWRDDRHAALTTNEADYVAYSTGTDPSYIPRTALAEPIGTRVLIESLRPHRMAAVRLRGGRRAYTYLGRLVPVIPPHTELRVAGDSSHLALFFPTLSTKEERAMHVRSGTALVSSGMAIATYDPERTFIVRVRVSIEGGPMRGQTGWMQPGSTGIPTSSPRDEIEKECGCLITTFQI
jgi:hypothetical protein